MHITLSFKDCSSICTCMLLIKKKNPEWLNRNEDITINKQPADEQPVADLHINRSVCVKA